MAVWRLQDAIAQVRRAEKDADGVRKLLDEEREANRSPLPLDQISREMTREELIQRAEGTLVAYQKEQRKNIELVTRLKQVRVVEGHDL